jgi:hypothetical protein
MKDALINLGYYISIVFRFVFPKQRHVRAYEQKDENVYTFVKDSKEDGGYRLIKCPFKDSACKVGCAYYSIKRGKVRCKNHVIGKLK